MTPTKTILPLVQKELTKTPENKATTTRIQMRTTLAAMTMNLGFSVRACPALFAWPPLNLELAVRTDVEYGDNRESHTITAPQGLVADRVGARVVRLVRQHRQAPQQRADAEDEDDEDDFYTSFWGSMRGLERAGDNWYPKITEPQPAGVKLLRSGDFGTARNRLGTPRNSNIYSRLRRMALQQRAVNPATDLKHNLIPNTHGTTVAAYYSNIYVAQFSPGTSFAILFLL